MTPAKARSVHAKGGGRRRVDALAAATHPHGRPAVWAALRRLGGGTVHELAHASGAPPRTTRGFLQALEFAGMVAREDGIGDAGQRWRVVGMLPADVPNVRHDGTIAAETGNARMWRSMKMLGRFTARDLSVAASLPGAPVTLGAAKAYQKALAAAGYLALVRACSHAGAGALAVYQLVRNTGPLPPQVQRCKQLFDANLRQVVWTEAPRA